MPYTYKFYMDTGRDGTYGSGIDDISDYVERANWFFGLSTAWEKIAPRANLTLTLNNASGIFSQTDSSATYYDKFTYGQLIKVTMIHNGIETTMCVLKVEKITPVAEPRLDDDEYRYQVTCLDIMPRLLGENVEVPLLTDVRVDEAITSLFDNNPFVYPYDSAYFFIGVDSIGGTKEIYDYTSINLTDFEEAYATLPYVGDNLDRGGGTNANQYLRDLMTAEYTGLFFYDIRSESFKFFHRNHNKIAVKSPYSARTSSATFDMTQFSNVSRVVYDVVNQMNLDYYPRRVGGAGSVVAQKNGLPIPFRAQDTKEFRFRYFDPDATNAQVGAIDVLKPQHYLDIIASSGEDGSGDDWTHFLILKSFRAAADHCTMVIFNRKVGDPAYVQTFQVRGTPIIAYQSEQVIVTNDDSRYSYDRRIKKEQLRLIATEDKAREYGTFFTNVFSDDLHVIERITIQVKNTSSDWLKSQIINRTIGDVITIIDANYDSVDYMIVGEQHLAVPENGTHQTSYVLRANQAYLPFIIDESSIGGNHLIVV